VGPRAPVARLDPKVGHLPLPDHSHWTQDLDAGCFEPGLRQEGPTVDFGKGEFGARSRWLGPSGPVLEGDQLLLDPYKESARGASPTKSRYQQPFGTAEPRWNQLHLDEGDNILLPSVPDKEMYVMGKCFGTDFQSGPERGDLWGQRIGSEGAVKATQAKQIVHPPNQRRERVISRSNAVGFAPLVAPIDSKGFQPLIWPDTSISKEYLTFSTDRSEKQSRMMERKYKHPEPNASISMEEDPQQLTDLTAEETVILFYELTHG